MFGLLSFPFLTTSAPIDSLEAQIVALERTAVLLRNSLLVSNFFTLRNLLSAVYTVWLALATFGKSSVLLQDSHNEVHVVRCALSYAPGLQWCPFVTDDCEINDLCYPLSFLDSSCIQRIVIDSKMPSTQQ